MNSASGSDERTAARTPKRGAFPTPRSELEKAEPFVPDRDESGDQTDEPTSPDD